MPPPRPRSCRRACRAWRRHRSRSPRRHAGHAAPRRGRAEPQHLLELGRDEQHGDAVVAERQHEPLHLGLRADVDPACRLVEDQQARLGEQPAREQDLLLVAAAQVPDDRRSDRRGRMSSASDPLGDQLVLPPAGDRPRPAAAGLQREDDVLAHRQLVDEALGAAVLGTEGDAAGRRRARAAHRHRLAVDVEPPRVGLVGAEEEPRDLGAARAEQAGEADDLARRDRQVERRDRALARDRLRLDHRGRGGPLATFPTRTAVRAPRATRARARASSRRAPTAAARASSTRRRAARCAGR